MYYGTFPGGLYGRGSLSINNTLFGKSFYLQKRDTKQSDFHHHIFSVLKANYEG